MSVAHVEVLVEEPSMEAALRILLPKLIPVVSFAIYEYGCKQNLLKCLPDRLKGYASWLPDDWRIVVIVDRDSDDCSQLKQQLEDYAGRAGLKTKTRSGQSCYQVANRLAIEELVPFPFRFYRFCLAYALRYAA